MVTIEAALTPHPTGSLQPGPVAAGWGGDFLGGHPQHARGFDQEGSAGDPPDHQTTTSPGLATSANGGDGGEQPESAQVSRAMCGRMGLPPVRCWSC
jgi:hypothetical protein